MQRIDKCLAHLGFGTRKEVKKIIKEKRVRVNENIVLKDDMKIDEINDVIYVDDIPYEYNEFTYIMLNKPQDYICSTEDSGNTVMDLIDDLTPNMFPVGRLDKDTEGLCFISNDGKLAHRLLSPKHHVEKKYFVRIDHKLSDDDIKELENGIMIDDELCLGAKVEIINDLEIYLTIQEGKYHQIKRMMNACDNEVTYLKRITMGPLVLDEDLSLGEYRYLTEEEIDKLKSEK